MTLQEGHGFGRVFFDTRRPEGDISRALAHIASRREISQIPSGIYIAFLGDILLRNAIYLLRKCDIILLCKISIYWPAANV